MSKSAWIHIIFGNACSTQGLWLDKIGGSENFLIFICYLGPLVHSVTLYVLSVFSLIPRVGGGLLGASSNAISPPKLNIDEASYKYGYQVCQSARLLTLALSLSSFMWCGD